MALKQLARDDSSPVSHRCRCPRCATGSRAGRRSDVERRLVSTVTVGCGLRSTNSCTCHPHRGQMSDNGAPLAGEPRACGVGDSTFQGRDPSSNLALGRVWFTVRCRICAARIAAGPGLDPSRSTTPGQPASTGRSRSAAFYDGPDGQIVRSVGSRPGAARRRRLDSGADGTVSDDWSRSAWALARISGPALKSRR